MAISAVNKKAGGGRAGEHPMLTGILIGLVLGVGLSAGVAVWVNHLPSPFQNRALEGTGPGPVVVTPPPSAAAPAGTPAGNGYPAATATPARPANEVSAAASTGTPPDDSTTGSAPSAANGPDAVDAATSAASTSKPLESGTATLQVGAFASEEDAMRQVETIAQVAGAHAQVIPPGGGQNLYRVRIGPVQRGNDLTELVDALKANGISSTVVRTPAVAVRANPMHPQESP